MDFLVLRPRGTRVLYRGKRLIEEAVCRWMKTTSGTISIYTDSKSEFSISSKMPFSQFLISEAMHMILSAESPDSEDLND